MAIAAGEEFEPVHLPQPAVGLRLWSWRLAVAGVAMGAVGALAAVLVRLGFRALQWVLAGSSEDPPIAAFHLGHLRRAMTPAIGALLASLVLFVQTRRDRQFNRKPRPYVEYVEAVRHEHGVIPLAPNVWRTVSAAFSVATGAAVGREGSMIQLASAVASACGRWTGWLGKDGPLCLPLLVACGVAGGVNTAYNAPVAAVFFAAEIVLGALQWTELALLALAAGAGWLVSGTILGRAALYPTRVDLHARWGLVALPVLAAILGLAGPVYQWLLGSLRRLRQLPLALLWSGLVVGWLSVLDPRVWGNGDLGLEAALGHSRLPGVSVATGAVGRVLALRLAATLSCVWTGTVGGVFTPTLFAGGALGALLGHLVGGAPATLWAVAGMSCLMAAVTHAPLMAGFMAAELTGDWKILPVVLPLNFVSWWIAHRLSPRAMYAIASQSPAHAEASAPDAVRR